MNINGVVISTYQIGIIVCLVLLVKSLHHIYKFYKTRDTVRLRAGIQGITLTILGYTMLTLTLNGVVISAYNMGIFVCIVLSLKTLYHLYKSYKTRDPVLLRLGLLEVVLTILAYIITLNFLK